MELKTKVLSATFWVGTTSLFSKIVSFFSTLLLATFLTPFDFGIIAVATLIISAIGLFKELGLSRSLIVQKEELEKAASTVFILLIIWNILLYLMVYLFAPWLAGFFKEPALIAVLRVSGLSFIISSFGDVHSALLEKEIDFKGISFAEAVNLTLFGLIAVILAFLGMSYWSIVFSQLLAESVKVFALWKFSPWRPKLSVNLTIARNISYFGGGLTGIGIVNYLIRNIDDAFAAKILGLQPLGHYNFAYRIANIPATNITNVIGRIMFPTYAKISEYTFDLRNAFNKTFYITALITIPMSLGIIVFAPDFLHVFYGEKWNNAILPIQILAIFGLIRSLGSGMGSVFLAKKRVDIMLKYSLSQLGLLTLFLYPVTLVGGIVGISILTTACLLFVFCYAYPHFKKMLDYTLSEMLIPCLTFLFFGALSIFFSFAIFMPFSLDPIIELIGQILLSMIFYPSLLTLFTRKFRATVKDLFKTLKESNMYSSPAHHKLDI